MSSNLEHLLLCLHRWDPILRGEIRCPEQRRKLSAIAPAQRDVPVCVSSSPHQLIQVTSGSPCDETVGVLLRVLAPAGSPCTRGWGSQRGLPRGSSLSLTPAPLRPQPACLRDWPSALELTREAPVQGQLSGEAKWGYCPCGERKKRESQR